MFALCNPRVTLAAAAGSTPSPSVSITLRWQGALMTCAHVYRCCMAQAHRQVSYGCPLLVCSCPAKLAGIELHVDRRACGG
jgi:hypothetical protein